MGVYVTDSCSDKHYDYHQEHNDKYQNVFFLPAAEERADCRPGLYILLNMDQFVFIHLLKVHTGLHKTVGIFPVYSSFIDHLVQIPPGNDNRINIGCIIFSGIIELLSATSLLSLRLSVPA